MSLGSHFIGVLLAVESDFLINSYLAGIKFS